MEQAESKRPQAKSWRATAEKQPQSSLILVLRTFHQILTTLLSLALCTLIPLKPDPTRTFVVLGVQSRLSDPKSNPIANARPCCAPPVGACLAKVIALHSQVITEYCRWVGAPSKVRGLLIRKAKRNGDDLGFLW